MAQSLAWLVQPRQLCDAGPSGCKPTRTPCLPCLLPAGVRGADFVCFYDWNEGRLVRRIDVGAVKDVIWSDNGELVAIAGDASFYILQVLPQASRWLCCDHTAAHITGHGCSCWDTLRG